MGNQDVKGLKIDIRVETNMERCPLCIPEQKPLERRKRRPQSWKYDMSEIIMVINLKEGVILNREQ